jgi:hypothetical protein
MTVRTRLKQMDYVPVLIRLATAQQAVLLEQFGYRVTV